jgi:hypothetical protein
MMGEAVRSNVVLCLDVGRYELDSRREDEKTWGSCEAGPFFPRNRH